MLLSIIIPVYKVERTLRRCVESVLSQLPSESEVILVDDGSPDACPALCDEWAQNDSRIVVVHQANGGLSAARNTGIECARGEWLTFVDSDDWLEPDTLPALLAEASKNGDCDLVEYPVLVYEGGRDEHLLTFSPHTLNDAAHYWLEERGYEHAYAWNKLYRRSLFDGVRYPVGKLFEDMPTTWQLLQHCRQLCMTDRGLYHYSANPAGITATAGHDELLMLLEPHVGIFQQLHSQRRGMDEALQRYFLHLLNIQLDVYHTGDHHLRLPAVSLPWSSMSLSGLPFASRLKALAYQLLGLKNLCQLSSRIHPLARRR